MLKFVYSLIRFKCCRKGMVNDHIYKNFCVCASVAYKTEEFVFDAENSFNFFS